MVLQKPGVCHVSIGKVAMPNSMFIIALAFTMFWLFVRQFNLALWLIFSSALEDEVVSRRDWFCDGVASPIHREIPEPSVPGRREEERNR